MHLVAWLGQYGTVCHVGGPRAGETSQAPRYRPSGLTISGPKGLCAMALRHPPRLCCGMTW
eukprot:427061-Lingulodinium_polyedra.AAC.1